MLLAFNNHHHQISGYFPFCRQLSRNWSHLCVLNNWYQLWSNFQLEWILCSYLQILCMLGLMLICWLSWSWVFDCRRFTKATIFRWPDKVLICFVSVLLSANHILLRINIKVWMCHMVQMLSSWLLLASIQL